MCAIVPSIARPSISWSYTKPAPTVAGTHRPANANKRTAPGAGPRREVTVRRLAGVFLDRRLAAPRRPTVSDDEGAWPQRKTARTSPADAFEAIDNHYGTCASSRAR